MTRDNDGRQLPADLEAVAAKLREARADADPHTLDRLKLRALERAHTREERPAPIRARIAVVLTLVSLVGGTGGALALASSDSGSGANGGAASGQYLPGKGCGDQNHIHTEPVVEPCP